MTQLKFTKKKKSFLPNLEKETEKTHKFHEYEKQKIVQTYFMDLLFDLQENEKTIYGL